MPRFPARLRLIPSAVVLLGALMAASAADTTPPPAPVNLRVLQLGPSPTRVAIQWNAVADTGGSGLKEYILYRNGLEVVRNSNPIGVDTYLLAGHTYSFQAAAVDNATNISLLSTALVVNALPPAPVTGTKSVKVLLLRFSDFAGEPFTTNDANDLVFNGPFSVKRFFEENSYGRLTLRGDAEGWYTLPHPGSNYCTFTLNGGLWYGCNTPQMLNDALSVIPDSARIGTNDVVILAIHGMGIVGLSGGRYKYVSATNGFAVSVIAHEIGHDFNAVQHAAGLDVCPGSVYPIVTNLFQPGSGPCFLGRYTDGYDTMAAGNSYHFNMFIKERMGFLLPENIQTATTNGDYVLHRAETPTNAVQMLKIPLTDEMFYFLEYRTPTGFDGPGTPEPGTGPIDAVLIHLRPSKYPGTDADTIRPRLNLNPGTPFLDPYRGLRVEVTEKLGDRVIVRLSGLGRPLEITDVRRTGVGAQDAQITFNSLAGAKYMIESSSNLTTWSLVRTNLLAPGPVTTNTLPGSGAPPANHFRARVDDISR